MPIITQDISGTTPSRIGDNGIEPARLAHLGRTIPQCITALQGQAAADTLPMFTLPHRTDDLPAMQFWANRTRQDYDHLVVLGTGGSSLGGHTFVWFARNVFTLPRVHFVDNTDPDTFSDLAASLDLARTAFLAISKSGGTVDTLAQILAVRSLIPTPRPGQFTVITMADNNPLHRMAQDETYHIIPHDPMLGGRFSVFSEVGLLPALFAGMDVAALRAGAATIMDESFASDGGIAATGAALHVAHIEHGRRIAVLMSYSDRLRRLGCWYRQTWAESVGKNGSGSTPVPAVGAVDQHSQLQLYLDGPRDKFFTLIIPAHANRGPDIAPDYHLLPYLGGKTMGDVMHAQALGTRDTLIENGIPTRVLSVDALNERALGGLLMHIMLETIYTAHLLGVNAFDQPAVEHGKQLTREYLLRKAV